MPDCRKIRFESFEADLIAGELRKNGRKLKLSGQPFQVLVVLLERPGEVVTREELEKRIWPDTFVDVDHNLNTAINKVREVLGDSPMNPRFVETLPRRGYRFIAAVNNGGPEKGAPETAKEPPTKKPSPNWRYPAIALAALAIAGGYLLVRKNQPQDPAKQRILTRITFDKGLQVGATWSPDGRFIAYASNRAGKFDIWLQQVSGGNPMQVTHRPGNNWQPDWSPDGKLLVYRSEEGDGGLFVVPAVGGDGQERKVSTFGYNPQWSPDGSRILFQATRFSPDNNLYVVGLEGGPPQPILSEFFARHRVEHSVAAATWHPDGKRITVSMWNVTPAPEFWTVVIGSAEGVKTEIDRAVSAQLVSAAEDLSVAAELNEFKFRWAPSADAIYFERTVRGARNLWKMTLDRPMLRATNIERLTTGAGADTELALSPDGTKLAFTSKAVHVAAWMFPFNASSGRLMGAGAAISAPGSATMTHAMSSDGAKIAILTARSGKVELWEKSLASDDQVPILIDDHAPRGSSWSPDGKRLAYYCEKSGPGENEIDLWSSDTRTQQRLMPPNTNGKMPHDWSPDGRELLIVEDSPPEGSSGGTRNSLSEIWSLPISPAPDTLPRKIATDPRHDLYQPHFSPDGHWIVFEAVTVPFSESILYVMPVKGGRWVPLPAIGHWDDKPRFSPDGKVIYYLSERHGFFNVWGIRFDKDRGSLMGNPFRVTNFESPDLMVPTFISPVELSIAKDKFVVNLAEVSGSIWMLEKVQ